MRLALHIAVLVFCLFALGFLAGGIWLWQEIYGPGPLTTAHTIVLEKGQDPAQTLAAHGIIRYALAFRAASLLTDKHKALQAGEYRFVPGTSMGDVIEALAEGHVVEHKITLPEGLTSYEVAARLLAEAELLGALDTPPEGTLLPQTYAFRKGEARLSVVQRMTEAMEAEIAKAWAARHENLPLTTPQEALILASIIEKEAASPDEYRRIAGVFVNRLRLGMPLQSDPTVLYALTKGRPQTMGQGPIGRRLVRSDFAVDSPYNTYKNPGLPPGPITNPGKRALTAATSPEVHDFLYFVAAPGGERHVFAKTLAEHQKNATLWRAARAKEN